MAAGMARLPPPEKQISKSDFTHPESISTQSQRFTSLAQTLLLNGLAIAGAVS